MSKLKRLLDIRKRALVGTLALACSMLLLTSLHSQERSNFPDGYDAVQAAPGSHKVIFENAFVRVLEVTVPPSGTTIPMHHHRWPSFFLSWDTGGKSPHIRYHRPDGSVRDIPSKVEPTHPGRWSVWMNPEPMHAIEVIESAESDGAPPDLRIEIKDRP
jgi:hypothetical protein